MNQEITMKDKARKLNSGIETAGWGTIFIWWGLTEMFTSLQHGIGAIGFGLILLGLNVVRGLNGLPARGFTTVLGILALALGGLELANTVLRLPFELPIFAILLILLGGILLVSQLKQVRTNDGF